MNEKKSKFEWGWFWNGCSFAYSTLCVNATKYTEEQAREIFKNETDNKQITEIWQGYVRYGYGVNDDGEKMNNWWLEEEYGPNKCPVWCLER